METWVFLLAMIGTLAAFRAPVLVVPFELHPDESQLISGGMTLRHDPVFWRAIDGHTSGPLNHYAMVLPSGWAGEAPYVGARVLGLLLVSTLLVASFLSARAVFGEHVARFGCIPMLAFFAFTTHPDHLHLSSEHVPIAMIALGMAAVTSYLLFRRKRWLVAAGLILAALPLAKPQTGPIAAVLALTVGALVWRREAAPERGRALLALLGGGGVVVAAFAVFATAFGLWRDIKISYWDANLSWVRLSRPGNLKTMVAMGWQVFSPPSSLFLLGAAAVAAGVWAAWGRRQAWSPAWFGVLALVGTLAAFTSVAIAGQNSPKYFLLLTPGLAFLVPALAENADTARAAGHRSYWLAATGVFLGLGVAWPALHRLTLGGDTHYPDFRPAKEAATVEVVAALQRWLQPGERLALWTAPPELYVRTGCLQANRDGETSRQMLKTPQRDYFRARYLADLRAWRPRVFLDGSAAYRRGFELEGFPELADYIAAHYRLEATVAGRRIYVRKDLSSSADRQ